MENIELHKFGFDTILFLTVTGIVIYGVFFTLKNYILPFIKSRKLRSKMVFLVFRLETLIWALFICFAITRLMYDNFWITLAITSFIIIAGFNFGRNFLRGLVFRLEKKFEPGDPVRFKDYTGFIEGVSPLSVQIKTDTEEILEIPYTLFKDNLLIKRQVKGKLLSDKIQLNYPIEKERAVLKEIEKWLYVCPWAVKSSKNNIQVVETGTLVIHLYAVDKETLTKAKSYLRQQINQAELLKSGK